jgi:hypothetical protein
MPPIEELTNRHSIAAPLPRQRRLADTGFPAGQNEPARAANCGGLFLAQERLFPRPAGEHGYRLRKGIAEWTGDTGHGQPRTRTKRSARSPGDGI